MALAPAAGPGHRPRHREPAGGPLAAGRHLGRLAHRHRLAAVLGDRRRRARHRRCAHESGTGPRGRVHDPHGGADPLDAAERRGRRVPAVGPPAAVVEQPPRRPADGRLGRSGRLHRVDHHLSRGGHGGPAVLRSPPHRTREARLHLRCHVGAGVHADPAQQLGRGGARPAGRPGRAGATRRSGPPGGLPRRRPPELLRRRVGAAGVRGGRDRVRLRTDAGRRAPGPGDRARRRTGPPTRIRRPARPAGRRTGLRPARPAGRRTRLPAAGRKAGSRTTGRNRGGPGISRRRSR